MIFYFEDNIGQQCDGIIDELNDYNKSQNAKLDTVLNCLMNIYSYTLSNDDELSDSIVELLDEIKTITDSLKKSIKYVNDLIDILNNIKPEVKNKSLVMNKKLKNRIKDYNTLVNETKAKMLIISGEYDDFINKYIKTFSFPVQSVQVESTIPENKYIKEAENTDSIVSQKNLQKNTKRQKKQRSRGKGKRNHNIESYTDKVSTLSSDVKDNRVLLISEKQKKVFLPYYVSDLEKILKHSSKYSNLQEIIQSEYVVPLARFSGSILSRFKETYNLMRKKERASITESLDIALELAFNNLLNPAIIPACQNLDELDIYLDCLSSNELDRFDIFKVEYEFMPAKV